MHQVHKFVSSSFWWGGEQLAGSSYQVTLCWVLTPALAKGIPALTLPSGALQWKGLLDVGGSAAVSQELSGARTV